MPPRKTLNTQTIEARNEWLTDDLKRIEEWVRLKARGEHYIAIAKRFGVTPGEVAESVKAYLAAWRQPDKGMQVSLMDHKLEEMEAKIWQLLEVADDPRNVNDAVRTLLKIMERRASLHGLDEKTDVVVNTGPILALANMSKEEILALASRPLLSEAQVIEGSSRVV